MDTVHGVLEKKRVQKKKILFEYDLIYGMFVLHYL